MKNHWLKTREDRDFFDTIFLVKCAYATCGTEHLFSESTAVKLDEEQIDVFCCFPENFCFVQVTT